MNKMSKVSLSILAMIIAPLVARAHGEDKKGPHGGFIRMPGAFHTEVLPLEKNQIRVYLLDINWKNPTVKSSSVKAKLIGTPPSEATCQAQSGFYLCQFDPGANLQKGTLVLETRREGQVGNAVNYDLPLRLQGAHSSPHH